MPIIELLFDNYASLTKVELKIFNQLQFIFVEYLYNPRHEPIDMNELYTDLKILGDLLHIKLTGKKISDKKISDKKVSDKKVSDKNINSGKKITSSDTKKILNVLAKGIHKKTRKNNIINDKNTRVSFKRGPKKRRFKKPFFLSLK
jgi:hypothetical protein